MENKEKTILQKGKERLGEAIFNEKKFVSYVTDLEREGLITKEKAQKVIHSLKESDAKAHLGLILKIAPFNTTFLYMQGLVTGGVAFTQGFWAGIKTFLSVEVSASIAKRIFVRWQGKDIKNVNRLANLSMVPWISSLLLLANLFEKHPDLVELYLSYSASKKSSRKKQKFEEDSPEYQVARYRIRKRFEKVKNGITLKVIKGVAKALSPSSKKLKENKIRKSVSDKTKKVISGRNTFMAPGSY